MQEGGHRRWLGHAPMVMVSTSLTMAYAQQKPQTLPAYLLLLMRRPLLGGNMVAWWQHDMGMQRGTC